jgi:hypothetical protein
MDHIVGKEIRRQVMQGSAALSSRSNRQEIIKWSQQAMERLDALATDAQKRSIMTGCACQYPKSDLGPIREQYELTGDVDVAHRMLQERFETFLQHTLQLKGALFREVVERGWGLAGVKAGDTIIATKIPKSGFLVAYMQERDPEKKRAYYCHCPRVRDVLKTSETLSPTYCFCGAGFYKAIWEEILQQPVEVEVLESVLHGGEVCTIAVHLPQDQGSKKQD